MQVRRKHLPKPVRGGSRNVRSFNPTVGVIPRLPPVEESEDYGNDEDDEVEVVEDPNMTVDPEIIEVFDSEEEFEEYYDDDEEESDIPKERKPKINDPDHRDFYDDKVPDYQAAGEDFVELLAADAADDAGYTETAEALREDAGIKRKSDSDIIFNVGMGTSNPYKDARQNWQRASATGKRKFNKGVEVISREWKRATNPLHESTQYSGNKRLRDPEVVTRNKKPRGGRRRMKRRGAIKVSTK